MSKHLDRPRPGTASRTRRLNTLADRTAQVFAALPARGAASARTELVRLYEQRLADGPGASRSSPPGVGRTLGRIARRLAAECRGVPAEGRAAVWSEFAAAVRRRLSEIEQAAATAIRRRPSPVVPLRAWLDRREFDHERRPIDRS